MSLDNFINRIASQTAVYWAKSGVGVDGQLTFAEPIEIQVVWQDSIELLKLQDSKTNEEYKSKAKIWSNIELNKGGYLFFGELTDLDSSQDCLQEPDAYQIVEKKRMKQLNADIYINTYYL